MKSRYTFLLLALSLPLCTVLRIIQTVFTIDGATGFIKQQYFAISTVITIVICAAIASVSMISIAMGGIVSKSSKLNPAVAVASVLLSGAFLFQTITNVSNLATGRWYDAALAILIILTLLVFAAYGIQKIYDFNLPHIVLAIPVVCYILKLISLFIKASELALVTKNIFLIFTNCMLLWFMFEFACFENQIGDSKKKVKKLFASGIAAGMFCVIGFFNDIANIIANELTVTTGNIAEMFLNFATAIFVFLYVFCNFEFKNEGKGKSKHSA